MTQDFANRRAMALRLDESPWQALPEMATCLVAERAGIEAGLHLVELFHLHCATRDDAPVPREVRSAHRHAFHDALKLRVALTGVTG